MTKSQPDYLSYLLRLRRAGDQEATWRASLEDPHTGDLHYFASLEEAFGFLRTEMGLALGGPTSHDGQPGREDRGKA